MIKTKTSHRFRSYVIRNSRITDSQTRAYSMFYDQYHLPLDVPSHYESSFGRLAPTVLEIGFGTGQSLLAAALQMPGYNFIGVETHKPGIGSLLAGIRTKDLTNIRFYHGDVVDIVKQAIGKESLASIQIFFPDPWPKRKHHPRRLIQVAFMQELITKLQPAATLHLATDWQDYALHMLKVLQQLPELENLAAENYPFAERSPYRPIISKFEQRALTAGRRIWDLQFAKR